MKTTAFIVVILLLAAGSAGAFPLSVQTNGESLKAGESQLIFQVNGPDDAVLQAEILNEDGWRVGSPHKVSDKLLVWDGKDDSGRPVHAGTYFVQIMEDPYLWNGRVSVRN